MLRKRAAVVHVYRSWLSKTGSRVGPELDAGYASES
jgi:hypothetical protein